MVVSFAEELSVTGGRLPPICTSARSGDLLGNGEMLVMRTIEDPANPIGEFVGAQQPVGFDYFALAMNPLGLYGVQPRTLLGQQATHDPHSASAVLDAAIVLAEPAPHLLGDVPAGVVPDEKQDLLSSRLELLQAPRKKLRRYRTHRPSTKRSHVSSICGR